MDMETKRRKVLWLVNATLAVMVLIPLTLLSRLYDHYEKICPVRQDDAAGAIFPLNEHGSIVYLTLSQHKNIVAGEAYAIGTWVCAVAVGVWANRKRRDLSD
jgi:hypothetical protein